MVFPLLQNDRANIGDACDIWVRELAALLQPELQHQPRLFDRAREGQMTNVTAFLIAHCSPERRHASLRVIETILKRQQRIVQQPLGSTSNWTRWDGALVVSMWILIFARWCTALPAGAWPYRRRTGGTRHEFLPTRLGSVDRRMASKNTGNPGELAAWLEKAANY